MRKLALGMAAGLAAMTVAAPANAAVVAGPEAGVQSCSAFTFNVAILNCAGGYAGNQQSGSLNGAGALAGLAALGGGSGTYLDPKLDSGLSDKNGGIIDFATLLTGYTVFGIHTGGAGVKPDNGNATFLFAFDAGAGLDKIILLDRAGANDTGLSNAALYRTGGGAVPEPATWAMMLIGFGAVGVGLRRRKRSVLQAA